MAEESVTHEFVEGTKRHYRSRPPIAPGASFSPQLPGRTPDRSGVPGNEMPGVPKAPQPVVRPLTQYHTSQEIMDTLPAPNEEAKAEEFEQSPSSRQEHRKAYPWQRTPIIPADGFALSQGVAPEPPAVGSGELDAIEADSSANR